MNCPNSDQTQVHGTAVAVGGRGCLIVGASGRGKSTLALEIISGGGLLVADDRVDLARAGPAVSMAPPPPLAGLIEIRGAGLLRMPTQSTADLALIVDLDLTEPNRLPHSRTRDLLGISCPVISGQERAGLAAICLAILRHGPLLDVR